MRHKRVYIFMFPRIRKWMRCLTLLTTFNVAMVVKIQHSTDYVIKHESDLLKRFRSTSEASTVL